MPPQQAILRALANLSDMSPNDLELSSHPSPQRGIAPSAPSISIALTAITTNTSAILDTMLQAKETQLNDMRQIHMKINDIIWTITRYCQVIIT